MYPLLFLCHYINRSFQQLFHCLSLSHNVPTIFSVSLYPLLFFTVWPESALIHNIPSVVSVSLCQLPRSTIFLLSLNTSHFTVCWFCETISTAAFYSTSNVSQRLTKYPLLFLCHYNPCSLLQYANCESLPHTEPSVSSVPLYPLLPPTVCPMSVNNLHCTVSWFCVTISNAVFYSLSTVCQ